MPTSKGFTGQYADAATGLDYYGARYYDPQLGQFTSADTVNDGINRYGYVKGNPETMTDPTGHRMNRDDGYCDKPPPPKQKTPPPPTCTSDATCGCYASCGDGGGNPNPTDANGTGGKNGSIGGGRKGGSKPSVYDRVLAECGPLAGICASVIHNLGGAKLFDNKDAERWIGIILGIAGVAVDFADAIYTISHAADKGKGIAIALAALGAISLTIGYLSNGDMPNWIKGTMFAIATVVDTLAGGFEAAAALYLELGPWGEFAANAAVTTVTTAAEGETAPVMGVLGMLGGDAVTYVLGTMGSALTSVGESLISDSYA